MTNNRLLKTIKNFVSEIDYFERMVNAEKKLIKTELQGKIDKAADPYSHLDIVSEHLIEALAALSVRVKLIENSLTSETALSEKTISNPVSARHNLKLVEDLSVTADRFCNQQNFYGEEKTDTGLFYSWTGPSPVNTFELPILRQKDKFGQFRFISIVDEALLKDLIVKVDGESVQIKRGFNQGQHIIEFKIPSSKEEKVTSLSLVLPQTISPLENGKGQDARRLGIALSSVSVSKKRII
jgi:hypothetical protein